MEDARQPARSAARRMKSSESVMRGEASEEVAKRIVTMAKAKS
jgi:hypothetical protein